MLGGLHLSEFSLRLSTELFEFMRGHYLADLGVGLGLLFLANQWGNIKPYIPSWLKYRTIHDRLHDFENVHIPQCEKRHTEMGTRMVAVEALSEQVGGIGETSSSLVKSCRELSKLIEKLMDSRDALTAVLNSHKNSGPC